MKQIILMLIIGLLGFSMIGCHGCKEPVVDPCEGVEEVTADFKMEFSLYGPIEGQWFSREYRWFESDTFLPGHIRFTAEGVYDSVKWKVGLDPRVFTAKQFSLDFYDFSGSFDMRMIGYRKPNNGCFPDDDGIDTIFKPLVVVPYSESKVFGHYDGCFLSEPDSSFQLFIDYNSSFRMHINEFPKGYLRDPGEYGFTIGYRHFAARYSGSNGQQGPKPGGWGEIVEDTIKFDFHHYLPNGGEVTDTYIGVKF